MEIIVEGHRIETKNIIWIYPAGFGFHGFIIKLLDGTEINLSKRYEYEASATEIMNMNKKFDSLENKVREFWEKDKIEIPILKL